MTFDFEEGIVRYSTTISSGIKDGFTAARPREVSPSEFVNFFVFDGELAEQLLSHDHTNAQLLSKTSSSLDSSPTSQTSSTSTGSRMTAHRGATEDKRVDPAA